MDVQNIIAVARGAKFCECGGLMVADKNSGYLMSNPPKQKIHCPFCGETDAVEAPYKVDIQFRKELNEKYQYREVGGGSWMDCNYDWYLHCQSSSDFDTRKAP